MPVYKFNKKYKDKELDRLVKPGEEVEMTIKRAEEIEEGLSRRIPGFKAERVDEPEKETKKPKKKETKEKE